MTFHKHLFVCFFLLSENVRSNRDGQQLEDSGDGNEEGGDLSLDLGRFLEQSGLKVGQGGYDKNIHLVRGEIVVVVGFPYTFYGLV